MLFRHFLFCSFFISTQKRFLPFSFTFACPCLAGWTSHWAKDFQAPTKETGTNPKRKGPVTKWTQQSYPRSKQTGESVPGAAETQQDTEGMCHTGCMTCFACVGTDFYSWKRISFRIRETWLQILLLPLARFWLLINYFTSYKPISSSTKWGLYQFHCVVGKKLNEVHMQGPCIVSTWHRAGPK